MLPVEYDKGFFKSDPHKMFKIILSDLFMKTQPSLLTFNAIIYSYFKVGAYEECVKIFEYMQKHLDISYDFSITISTMSKVYYKLGEIGKAASLARLDNSEIMAGDHISIGAQFGVMLSAGRHEELEGVYKEIDENRDMGSQNMTYVLRMYIKE
jgi:pentatricopeptide repeat protein